MRTTLPRGQKSLAVLKEIKARKGMTFREIQRFIVEKLHGRQWRPTDRGFWCDNLTKKWVEDRSRPGNQLMDYSIDPPMPILGHNGKPIFLPERVNHALLPTYCTKNKLSRKYHLKTSVSATL